MDRVAHKKQISRKSNKGLVGCYNSLNNITALNQHQPFQSHDISSSIKLLAFSLFSFLSWWENAGLRQSQAMN